MKRDTAKALGDAIERNRSTFDGLHVASFDAFMSNVGAACFLVDGSKVGPAQTCLNMAALFLLAHERITREVTR